MCIEDYREGHILLGLFLTLAAIVMLSLATFSSPFRHDIYFLSITDGHRFGAFGYCPTPTASLSDPCTKVFGYAYRSNGDQQAETIEWLTKAVAVCFPAGAVSEIIAFFALLWSLCTSACCMTHHLWFRTWKFIGCSFAVLGKIFALVLFISARNRFHEAGMGTSYGPALWIAIGAVVAAVLGLIFGGPKYGGRYMYRAHEDYPYHL